MDRSRHHHEICFADAPPIKKGLHQLLDLLEARKIPRAVATSTRRDYAIPRLQQCGLVDRFATITTGDQIVHGKPAPDIYLLAARTINVQPSRCVALEDSEAGVCSAHAAGMTVCMVPDLKQPSDDIRRRAQGVYDSLLDVHKYLETALGN